MSTEPAEQLTDDQRELESVRRRFIDTEDALMRSNRKLMKVEEINGALLAALVEVRDHGRDDDPAMWERVEKAIALATKRRQG